MRSVNNKIAPGIRNQVTSLARSEAGHHDEPLYELFLIVFNDSRELFYNRLVSRQESSEFMNLKST